MRPRTSLTFVVALLLFGLFRMAQAVPGGCPIEGATPMNIGPLNPQNGFPLTVQDSTGLTVEMCLDPALCISDPPIPGNAFSEQIGFGAEGFWAAADAEIVTAGGLPNGIDALLVTAVEAAFNTETPVDGDQFPFTRLRLRIDIPFAGIYTVTHPWGREVYTITTPDRRAVNESFDIQFFANSVHQGRIGPLLRWDTFGQAAGAPPAGFLGDPAVPHAVTGSPCGTNFFRIEAVGLDGTTPLAIDPADIDGDGRTDRVTETLFTVSGKVFTGVVPSPLVTDRTVYARQANNAGQVDVFATSSPDATVTVSGGPNLPAGELPLVSGQNGLFFTSIPLADASTLPATVRITATSPGSGPTTLVSPLTDAVNITRAEYDETAQTLTIEATSSDELTSPLLTAFGLGDLNNGSRTFTNVLAPPDKVTVTSAAGGWDREDVTVVAGTGNEENRPPVAVNDVVTTPEDSAVTIPVLANDSDEDGDALLVTSITPPANGTAVINPENTGVIYTPNLNFNGTDSFSYTVSDGQGGTASATVAITVTSVNDPPVAVNDTAATAAGTAVIINVLANDSDVDSVTRSVSAVTQPANGVVVINAGNTGVTYTPNAGFSGSDTFTYTVSDGQGGSAQASVTVTVSDGGATDNITVIRAEVRVAQNRWRISGAGAAPNSTITVHLGPNLNGAIIGIRNADQNGNWVVDARGTPPGDPPTTISAESSGGSQVLNVPVVRL